MYRSESGAACVRIRKTIGATGATCSGKPFPVSIFAPAKLPSRTHRRPWHLLALSRPTPSSLASTSGRGGATPASLPGFAPVWHRPHIQRTCRLCAAQMPPVCRLRAARVPLAYMPAPDLSVRVLPNLADFTQPCPNFADVFAKLGTYSPSFPDVGQIWSEFYQLRLASATSGSKFARILTDVVDLNNLEQLESHRTQHRQPRAEVLPTATRSLPQRVSCLVSGPHRASLGETCPKLGQASGKA